MTNRNGLQLTYHAAFGIKPMAGGAMKPYWQTGGVCGVGRLA